MPRQSSPAVKPRRPASGLGFWAFIALMGMLTLVFVGLGIWQVERLGEKETLIANVAARQNLPPVPAPPVADWPGLDIAALDYRPVSLTGHFVHDDAVMVFTNLADAKGKYGGVGYWLMTPFALDGGGTVFVNRGFLPQSLAATFDADITGSDHTVTLTGLVRAPESANQFTPAADAAHRIDWLRNPERLADLVDAGLAPVAPFYVDLPAQGPGVLPQGGETVVEFPNSHLGYAMTWFGFAILTPIMLVVWIARQRRRAAKR